MIKEPPWDTEIDTPATIAIVGAGPFAIESALYARFLGYAVEIYSQRRVGTSLIPWSNQLMPGRLGDVTTTLGRAALQAQENPCKLDLAQPVTYGEYFEHYLLPLAKTDLVHDSVNIQSRVASISRFCSASPSTSLAAESRAEQEFRVSVQSIKRGWHSQLFDIVIDASGRPFQPGIGPGGGLANAQEDTLTIRDIPTKLVKEGQAGEYGGKHTVLVGASIEACLAATQLHCIGKEQPATHLTWLLPPKVIKEGIKIDNLDSQNPLGNIVLQANELIARGEPPVVALPAWGIEKAEQKSPEEPISMQIRTSSEDTVDLTADFLMHFGHRKLESTFASTLDTRPLAGVATHEPHFYRVGSNLDPSVPWSADCYAQIQQLFGYIGGRPDLDLYSTVAPSGS